MQLGIEKSFKVAVTGNGVEKGKPDPTIYRLAAKGPSQAPESLLAVEGAISGIRAARLAGLRCLGIGSGPAKHAMSAAGPEHVLPILAGLSVTKLKTIYSYSTYGSLFA